MLDHPSHPGRQKPLVRHALGFFPRVSPVDAAHTQEDPQGQSTPSPYESPHMDAGLAWDESERELMFSRSRTRAQRPQVGFIAGVIEFFAAPLRLFADIVGPRAVTGACLLLVVGGILLAAAAPPSVKPSPSASPAKAPTGTGSQAASAPAVAPAAPLPTADADSMVFLILGVDSMEDRGRSDTILVINLMLSKKKIRVLSIPRDYYANIQMPSGTRQDKLNHSFRFGGAELTKKTVETELGIHVDYYGVVDYDLFRKVIDLMGGIPLDVEKRLYYVDRAGGLKVDLQPGPQLLNGDHALQYVRFRHDGAGDEGRIKRQQHFVSEGINKIKDLKVATFLAYKLPSLLEYVATNVPTQLAMALLWKVKDISPKDLQVRMVPGDGRLMETPIHKSRLWFFLPDKDQLEKLKADWFFNPNAAPEVIKPEKRHKGHRHHSSPAPGAPASPGHAGSISRPAHGESPSTGSSGNGPASPRPRASPHHKGTSSKRTKKEKRPLTSPSPQAVPASSEPAPEAPPVNEPTTKQESGAPGAAVNPPVNEIFANTTEAAPANAAPAPGAPADAAGARVLSDGTRVEPETDAPEPAGAGRGQ